MSLMVANPLPARSPRISEEQQLEICRLSIRQVSGVEIARRVGVNRHTVRRVLERSRAALRINSDLAPERAEAIVTYREIQRAAWEAADAVQARGRSPAMLLAEVRLAQTRIDALLGLAPPGPDDPVQELVAFKAVVVNVIQTEAPELAPRLAKRLLTAMKAPDGP
jgi:hypothetical protein